MKEVLEGHFERYPETRPNLGDLAIAAAEFDDHPLASQHALIRRSAEEILQRHPDASPADVLLWAEARTLPAESPKAHAS